jgi:transcriptional regulator with XRE-family HTH domain
MTTLKPKKLTQKEVADKLGWSRQQLNAVLNGRDTCSFEVALLIQEKSNGQFKAEEFFPRFKKIVKKVKAL